MVTLLGIFLMNILLGIDTLEFEADYPIVEAVEGLRASIPCNVSTPLADDQATLILWYRADLPNPIYTVDIRGGALRGARHFPAPEFGARASFDLEPHPPLLLLEDARRDDEGDYRCRVDLRRSRTLILHSRLRIIVPPSEPIIMDEHGQRLHGVVGPYDEGSTINFVCEVDGGDPSPNVTWWRGPEMVDNDFTLIRQRFVRNELVLERIGRTDLMAEYACQASNTPLAKPWSSSIQLDINLLPTEARIKGVRPILYAGEEHEFVCETRGSRPRALTSWWLEGHRLGPGGTTENQRGNVTRSTLRFTPRPEDDGQRLVCRSGNPALPGAVVEDDRLLRVQFQPMVNLSLVTNGPVTEVKEGSTVRMECKVWANPWIFEVAWEFEDRPLLSNRSSGVSLRNQTLVLQRVGKNHRGRYRCSAKNPVGQGYSNDLHLLIKFTPVCRSMSHRIHGVSASETADVSCDVDADPDDVTFRWSLNNTLGSVMLSDWSSTSPLFQYTPRVPEDFGYLLCWGRNNIGSQQKPCVIKIVPAGAPESPHDCSVVNHTSESLTIECLAGYNGSLIQMFHMEIYNSLVEHMADNVTAHDKPIFKVIGLAPGTSYVLVIYASNVKGRSNSVALVASTLAPAERRTAEDEFGAISPILGAILGVLVVFVLIVIVVIICVKTHSSRRRSTEKDAVMVETSIECSATKKELDEGQEGASEKNPDIIPLSIEPDVFFTGKLTEDSLYGTKPGPAPGDYVRKKYTHTVL